VSTGFALVRIGMTVSGVSSMDSARFIFAFRLDRISMPRRPLKWEWKLNNKNLKFSIFTNCLKCILSVYSRISNVLWILIYEVSFLMCSSLVLDL